MNYKKIALALTVSTFAAGLAHAEPYVGAGIGKASNSVDGLDDATSINLTAGLKFNDYFAVQASYVDLGDFDIEEQTFNYPGVTINASGSVEVTAYEASAVAFLPFNDKFRGFARLGLFSWDAEGTYTTTGTGTSFTGGGFTETDSASDSGTDLVYGVGVQYSLSNSWSVEGEWAQYDTSDDGVSVLGVGVNYHF